MGAYLSAPATEKSSDSGEGAHHAFGLTSMQGWRTTMEDAHCATLGLAGDASMSIFGVFDGHGGREVAQYCQAHMVERLVESEAFKAGDMGQALIDTFLDMDELMLTVEGRKELARHAAEGQGKSAEADMQAKVRAALSGRSLGGEDDEDEDEDDVPDMPQSGSTSVVAVVRGNELTVANAGDSRGVLCRRDKEGRKAIDLSEDHKPTLESEMTRIKNAGGFVADGRVNGSLALSRAIGDMEFKQSPHLPAKDQVISACPDITVRKLEAGDEFMVLACDGIWDVMTSQECIDYVGDCLSQGFPLATICEKLCDKCLAPDTKGNGIGCDNMTVVIVTLKDFALSA